MDFRAICHGCALPARSAPDWKRQRFRRCKPGISLSSMAAIPYNSRCTAGMTTSCCSPCLRAKQNSCRRPFEVWLLPQLAKLPETGTCWCWKRTAERPNSYPAAGIPSAKSSSHGQYPSLTRSAAVQMGTLLRAIFGRFPRLARIRSLDQKGRPEVTSGTPSLFSELERLEVELRRELQQARISGRRDDPKGCWGINVVGWVVELCVVPDVEHFQPQFNVLR